MASVDDLRRQIMNLEPDQAAVLAEWMRQTVPPPVPGIESTPGVMGGDACIAGTRLAVWILEQYRRQGMSEAEILKGYPQLRAVDLVNAWQFIAEHQADIEQQIVEHETA